MAITYEPAEFEVANLLIFYRGTSPQDTQRLTLDLQEDEGGRRIIDLADSLEKQAETNRNLINDVMGEDSPYRRELRRIGTMLKNQAK